MRTEIGSAVDFLSNILVNGHVPHNKCASFRQCLKEFLMNHYQDHWFPDRPNKGSAYRCLRINHKMDPLILKAGTKCGLSQSSLFTLFPRELTMWVDPMDVSYRIGEDGSIGVLYPDESSSSDDSDSDDQQTVYEQDSQTQVQPHHVPVQPMPVSHSPTDFQYFESCKQQYYATTTDSFKLPYVDDYGYLSSSLSMSTTVAS